jgi:hypothetical protein
MTWYDGAGYDVQSSRRGELADCDPAGGVLSLESLFSMVMSEIGDRFGRTGEAKLALFDYIELFYSQRRRHSTVGHITTGVRTTGAARGGGGRPPRTRFLAAPTPLVWFRRHTKRDEERSTQ